MFNLDLTPRQEDRAIALGGLLGGLVLIAFGAYDRSATLPVWAVLVPLVALAVLELFRRTHPVWTVSVGGLLIGAVVWAGSLAASLVMYTDLLYAAVLYGSPRMSKVLHLTGMGTTVVLGSWAGLYTTSVAQALLAVVVCVLVFLGPVWTADLVRKHRDRAETERLRAEQTALLAELDRREAVVSERARMARELHDVVANHLSAIAIHATGAQALARRQERDPEDPLLAAMAVIRENSVQGLTEMRRMIGLLRAGDAEDGHAAPRLDAVDALVAKAAESGRAAGLGFRLTERGERGELPAPVELAAYRIVQEALTNALKHAAPGSVEVLLAYGAEELEIRVESPYRAGEGRGLPGARAGLVGMAERAGLLGGSFAAEPVERSWVVRAVLPREPGTTGGRV
ncbi:sensor histidine kinase [Kitasatospora sp. NPDC051853]|uniref:sensor histidine kinase n=1 Tax=Kitasatospora sp. NPDC051853 TaxID=3364058 RepID=UPI00379F911C